MPTNDPIPECEAAQVAIAVARSNNRGCVIIVVAIIALLAWVAYLLLR